MPEPQANKPMNFRRFTDWCLHKDSLSESARYTVEVLLKLAGTSDCNEADKVLSNLTKLYLVHDDKITDITPLSALTNLRELALYNNQITDITPLSALTNLRELALYNNQITDITPLSALTNLTYLNLYNNQITDITPLSALTNLTTICFNENQITDLTPLSGLTNLTTIQFNQNQITDITPLSGLTNLTSLYLSFTKITDITPLSALTNLTELYLCNNQITDITSLSGLTNLIELLLIYNQITDITPLSALTNLTRLQLENNQITDITPLSGLTNLTLITLQDNPVTHLNLSVEITHKYLILLNRPIDTQKAAEAVKKIYAAIGKEAPQVIVCNSPQLASVKLCQLLQIGSISQDQMSEIASGNSIWRQPLLRGFFPWVNVGFSGLTLCEALSNAIKIELNGDRILDLDYILVSEFREFLENDLESLGDDFRSCCNYLEPLSPTKLVKEIHVTEFLISKFGITLDDKARELLRCKQQLFEECGWILPFEKVCLICDRPLHIRFDTENRLHAEGESAIAFADGYSLYFHHGVKLPEQYGKVHPDLWQAEWLLSEENAEIRRLLIQRIGYDRICQQLQAVELDSWQEYTLLKIENADVEPIYLLKMTCPSTGYIHALRVPPNVVSAQEAIRWVNWDIDSEEFSVQT